MKLFDVYPLFDITPVRGEGCYVYDDMDKQYLDLYGGHAVISIGHSHPHYMAALEAQLHKLVFYSNSVQNPLQQELADKLGALSGCGDYQLFLCNSGAEANENALKMASFRTGRTKVVAFRSAFHGRTSVAVNVTDNESIKSPINKTFQAEFLPLNDLEALEKALAGNDVAAVIVEGTQGIGGIFTAEADFLEGAALLCKKHGTCLVLDEVQSGYGRTGRFFAFQRANIRPDLITVAKGMGNGFPIGGLLVGPDFPPKHGQLGTTFGGSHLACAAGIAVLDVLKNENLIENSARVGAYLATKIEELGLAKEVRGEGLMLGIDMGFSVKDLRKKLLFEAQVFTGSSNCPNTMRLLPPLSLGRKEADLFVEAFAASCVQHATN
jgi:acetylornithine/N-succinyldiaminopimelate aminotransferase